MAGMYPTYYICKLRTNYIAYSALSATLFSVSTHMSLLAPHSLCVFFPITTIAIITTTLPTDINLPGRNC